MENEQSGGQRYLVADYTDHSYLMWLMVTAGRVASVQPATFEEAPRVAGFVRTVEALGKKVVAGYFSAAQPMSGKAPDYAQSFLFIIDGHVFGEGTKLCHAQRFRTRILRIKAPQNAEVVVEYVWPFYRELVARLLGDPANFRSEDFIWELVSMVKFYRPQWMSGTG